MEPRDEFTWQKLELWRGHSHCKRCFREQREGRRNTLASPYQREGPGMDLSSKQALDQHLSLEEMNPRIVALRETVIPPSIFAFSQSTPLCQSKDLFGGFRCCLAGWCGGG